MPYIKQERRMLAEFAPQNAGELNFAISTMIRNYAFLRTIPMNYQSINDIIGALEGAKSEFTRRVVNPYEDTCIARNGDIY